MNEHYITIGQNNIQLLLIVNWNENPIVGNHELVNSLDQAISDNKFQW